MVDLLTRAGSLPFSVALALMLMFALLQIVGAGDFLGGDADVDAHAGVHAHGGIDAGLLSVLGIGRVPFLMWLMLLLTVFGLVGISAQELLLSLTGHTWSAWLVAPVVGLASLPVTGMLSRGLGRIIPQDETTAIDISALVGREAEILVGTATPGSPARGRVVDFHGQPTMSWSSLTSTANASYRAKRSCWSAAMATYSRASPGATTIFRALTELRMGNSGSVRLKH